MTEFISVNSRDGRYLFASAGCRRLLGYEPHELVGRSGIELVHPDDAPAAKAARKRVDDGDEVANLVIRMRHKDGRWVWTEITARPTGESTGSIVVVARDATERRRVEEELHEAEERFRRAFEEAPTGMAIVDLEGKWTQVNQALAHMLGYDRDELTGRSFASFTHPDDRAADRDALAGLVSGRISAFRTEKRYVRKDRRVIWVRLAVVAISAAASGDAGRPAYLVSQIQDISEERARQQRLSVLALHDALTGLPNRVLLLDRLGTALARLDRAGGRVAVLFLDLDGFKAVNDRFGHTCGDDVLAEAAHRLAGCVRSVDTVARYGGDEFVVVCEDARDAEVRALVRRIRRRVSRPFAVGDELLTISVSIGVVATEDAGEAPIDVIDRADRVMYRNKVRQAAR